MKFYRMSLFNEFITRIIAQLNIKTIIVANFIYPRDIINKIDPNIYENSGIERQTAVQSSKDNNWYTLCRKTKRLYRADEELAEALDKLCYIQKQLSCVNKIIKGEVSE